METPDQSGAGYPEEQPAEVTQGGGTMPEAPQEEGADPERDADQAPSNDDGTATGNP
jgi:hypothetical protein